jgi:hypothetical protein
MALEATHIRFALDIVDEDRVHSFREYLSGTIYPDSRYVTGIDRNLTHNKDILCQRFVQNDFTRGWQAHCICDEVQRAAHKTFFPEIDSYERTQRWVYQTALKMLQDMNDAQKINVQQYVHFLDYADNPNNENIDLVRQFNQAIQETYRDGHITSKRYFQMCITLRFEQRVTNSLIEKLETFMQALDWIEKMENNYEQMMNDYRRHWLKVKE